jgi:hypothetical protein
MKFKRNKLDESSHILTSIVVFSYFPISILIVFLTPQDVLNNYAWARSFADFTARFIPLVAEIGRISSLPELYFAAAAINLAAIVFSFLSLFSSLTLDREFYIKFSSELSLKKVKTLLSVLSGVFFFWLVLFKSPPSHLLAASKFNMGIYGIFFFGIWYVFALDLLLLSLLVFFSNNISKDK